MKFIKNSIFIFAAVLSGLALFGSCNKIAGATTWSNRAETRQDTTKITLLQTADIHGQLEPHLELSWENDSIVFKERGGLANLQTLFKEEKAKNPDHTFIFGGGDLFQGSEYAALSKGDAQRFCPGSH